MRSFSRWFVIGVLAAFTVHARAENFEWVRQFGTDTFDRSFSVAADKLGNVFVSAETLGDLGGPNAGNYDSALLKYDATGNLIWKRQFGSANNDWPRPVTADGLGNVYISGTFTDSSNVPFDAYLKKFDTNGALLWSRQFGTPTWDEGLGASTDGMGNVYVGGSTLGQLSDPNANGKAFLRKYTAEGSLAWTRQFGEPHDLQGGPVATDKLGNVFMLGESFGTPQTPNEGQFATFVSKFDAEGNMLWRQRFGALDETRGNGIATDELGNVYISGTLFVDADAYFAGKSNAFVRKYDAGGNVAWTRLIESGRSTDGYGIASDGLGSVYLSGGVLTNDAIHNGDAFFTRLDSAGNIIWTSQLGTSELDGGLGVSADGLGNVYFSGVTEGDLAGTNVGHDSDVFVAKISDVSVPEPISFILVGTSTFILVAFKKPCRLCCDRGTCG
jgi:hypothetical protein